MSNQKKVCKPNYRMDHFKGCGNENYIFKYGACQSCFISWATTTKKGKEWHAKQTAYKMKEKETEKRVENRNKKRQMKIEQMSNIDYWSNELQPNINLICRLIDQGHSCIATNNFGKMNGGHYISVGACRTISLNLHNIFIQSFHSNHWKSGDTIKYQAGLIRTFGEDYFNWIETLRQTPSLNITKIEMIEFNAIARKVIKELKKEPDLLRSPLERISKRNEVNTILKIYDKRYSVYDPQQNNLL